MCPGGVFQPDRAENEVVAAGDEEYVVVAEARVATREDVVPRIASDDCAAKCWFAAMIYRRKLVNDLTKPLRVIGAYRQHSTAHKRHPNWDLYSFRDSRHRRRSKAHLTWSNRTSR